MYALLVVTCSLILMSHFHYFLLHIQRILPLFTDVLLLLLYLLMFYISLLQILSPLLMILYFLLNSHNCNNYIRPHNHNIFLGTLLILRNVVGKMLRLPLQISLRSALSLIILGTHILLFSLINNKILQITQILPPLIARSGSALPRSMSFFAPPATPSLFLTAHAMVRTITYLLV